MNACESDSQVENRRKNQTLEECDGKRIRFTGYLIISKLKLPDDFKTTKSRRAVFNQPEQIQFGDSKCLAAFFGVGFRIVLRFAGANFVFNSFFWIPD